MEKIMKKLLVVLVLVAAMVPFGVSCDTGSGISESVDSGYEPSSPVNEPNENEPNETVPAKSYLVTFSIGSSNKTQRVEEGQTITFPAVPVYDKAKFLGWEAYDGVYTGYYGDVSGCVPVDENTIVNQDMTIYAKYSYIKYEITRGTFKSNHYEPTYESEVKHTALNGLEDTSEWGMMRFLGTLRVISTLKIYQNGKWQNTDSGVAFSKYYGGPPSNTYNYTYINEPYLDGLFIEVKEDDGISSYNEIVIIDSGYYILFNYKNPLPGATWIAVKEPATMVGYL
jgi:hypothetical protein